AELTQKRADLDNNPALRHEVDILSARLKSWQNQLEQLGSPSWRPTRLQLAQALLTQTERDWLRTFLEKRRMKVHVYHLDAAGRAVKLADAAGLISDLTDLADAPLIQRMHQAVADL